ncbi:MAG: CHAP domain-containing protein [Pseudomonadota bacterium]
MFAQESEGPTPAEWLVELDPTVRPVVSMVLEQAALALESEVLQQRLTQFGLTPETVSQIVDSRIEETFSASVAGVGRDIALNLAIDAVAQAFGDIMMESAFADHVPQKLRSPVRALLVSTVAEGFGVAKAVTVDQGAAGPFALLFPVLDRIEQMKAIQEASSSAVESRNSALIEAALGAEINAQLLSQDSSARSLRIASQWLTSTTENLATITTEGEAAEISNLLEAGFDAIVAIRSGECGRQCQSTLVELQNAAGTGGAPDLALLTPVENALRLLQGYDPRQTFSRALVDLTSIQGQLAAGRTDLSSSGGTQLTDADISTSTITIAPEVGVTEEQQRLRMEAVCAKTPENLARTVSSADLVRAVRGLTGWYRERVISCLTGKAAFSITAGDMAQLVFPFQEQRRQQTICRLRGYLPSPQSPAALVAILGDMAGWFRSQSIKCLAPTLPKSSVSVADAIQVLGPLMPEQFEGWDTTLVDYYPEHHKTGICHLKNILAQNLAPEEVSLLLGQSRDYIRFEGLRCIVGSIPEGLSWNDVDVIIGESISSKGRMIDVLGVRTPDGRIAATLNNYLGRFKGRRFLRDRDPETGWLRGQCVQFARDRFALISDRSIDWQVGSAKNIHSQAVGKGFQTSQDPAAARIGALIVWESAGDGHVGIVTKISRDADTGLAARVWVAEANWGVADESTARDYWDIPLSVAVAETVTNRYGFFDYSNFWVPELDRPAPRQREPKSYKFTGYVYP